MLLNCPGKDQNVIQIYYYDAFYNKILEDIIYYCLEGSRAVCHPKEHYQGFKQVLIGTEGSLSFISRFDLYVIESLPDV